MLSVHSNTQGTIIFAFLKKKSQIRDPSYSTHLSNIVSIRQATKERARNKSKQIVQGVCVCVWGS